MLLLIIFKKNFADMSYSYPRHFANEPLLALFKRNSENMRNLLKFSEQMSMSGNSQQSFIQLATDIHHTFSNHGSLYDWGTNWIYG